jgi:hypothetical protein
MWEDEVARSAVEMFSDEISAILLVDGIISISSTEMSEVDVEARE